MLLLFLRSFTSTLVIAIAMPISVVGTFIVMDLAGRSFNVISLAGVAFAVGMVVDNSIVALENIFRHHQMGKSAARAAADGAQEVWGAILASTLTTVAVFLPVLFIEEEAGQLFRDIAIAISASVTLSMIVAITVIPSLSSKILGRRSAKSSDPKRGLGAPRLAGKVTQGVAPQAANGLPHVFGAAADAHFHPPGKQGLVEQTKLARFAPGPLDCGRQRAEPWRGESVFHVRSSFMVSWNGNGCYFALDASLPSARSPISSRGASGQPDKCSSLRPCNRSTRRRPMKPSRQPLSNTGLSAVPF